MENILTAISKIVSSEAVCAICSLFNVNYAVDRNSHGFVQDSERISLADDIIIKVFVLANPRVVYACTVYTENYRVSIRGF